MFSIVKPKALVGVLEPNNLLANPEKLFEGKISGPEHLMTRDGVIYTSLNNGDVIKIVDGKMTVIGKFGKLCCELNFTQLKDFKLIQKSFSDDEKTPHLICSRPLGMAFDVNPEILIVVDTSSGIYELNIKTGKTRQLVSEKAVFGSSVRKIRHPKFKL